MRKRHEAYEPCIEEGGLRGEDENEANRENNINEVGCEAVGCQADDEQADCKKDDAAGNCWLAGDVTYYSLWKKQQEGAYGEFH